MLLPNILVRHLTSSRLVPDILGFLKRLVPTSSREITLKNDQFPLVPKGTERDKRTFVNDQFPSSPLYRGNGNGSDRGGNR